MLPLTLKGRWEHSTPEADEPFRQKKKGFPPKRKVAAVILTTVTQAWQCW